MRKLDQSKKAKKEFKSLLLDLNLINSDDISAKQDLAGLLHTSERAVRKEISDISMYYPVISSSKQKGYRLAKAIDKLNDDELKQEIAEIERTIAETKSRVTILKAKMKPLIAYLKVAEKRFEKC